MPPESPLPAKLCPRCGAFYRDIRSQTCPQCFARLEILDDSTARRLAEEQAERVRDSNAALTKAQEDERFKEQSFGACLAVGGVLILTIIIAFVFVRLAALRYHTHAPAPSAQIATPSAPVSPDILLPSILAGRERRSLGAAALMPGTSTPLYEGNYGHDLQVYAVVASGLTREQEGALHFAASLAAQQHTPPFAEQEINTPKAQYAILGQTKAVVSQVANSLATENKFQ